MMKMMGFDPMGSMPVGLNSNYIVSGKIFLYFLYLKSVPGVGGDKKEEEGLTREELQEQERLR